jgi:O-antigen ligase
MEAATTSSCSVAMIDSIAMSRVAATRRLAVRPVSLIAVAALVSALAVGYAIAAHGPKIAVAILAAPMVVWVLARTNGGLSCAVALTLAVPYWYVLGTPQAAAFRVAAVCALATAVFARRVRPAVTDVAIGSIVLITVLGWVLQDDQAGVGKIVLNEMLPFAFYLSARTLPSDSVRPIAAIIVGAGTVGAATVIYEFLAGHVLFSDANSYSWNASVTTIFRPGGFFGSPPGASTVLALAILCGLPLVRDEQRKRRALLGAALATMLVACVLTFTRASLIGLGAGILVYLWLMRSALITPSRLIFAVSVLFATMTLILPQIERTTIFQRGVVRPGNLSARESYWGRALPIITASPHDLIFGIGTARTVIPRQGGTMPEALAISPVLVEHGTHNQYVLTTLEGGLIGLLALVAWLATAIGTGLRSVRRAGDALSAGLVSAMAAFAVIMLANNALLHPPSVAMAALVTGLLVARRSDGSAR